MVRVKGSELCIVQQNYISDLVDQVLLRHDQKHIKTEFAHFRECHHLQSVAWHTQLTNMLGIIICDIIVLFDFLSS